MKADKTAFFKLLGKAAPPSKQPAKRTSKSRRADGYAVKGYSPNSSTIKKTAHISEPLRSEFCAWLVGQGYYRGNRPSLVMFVRDLQRGHWTRSKKAPPIARWEPMTGSVPGGMGMPEDQYKFIQGGLYKHYASFAHWVSDVVAGNWTGKRSRDRYIKTS